MTISTDLKLSDERIIPSALVCTKNFNFFHLPLFLHYDKVYNTSSFLKLWLIDDENESVRTLCKKNIPILKNEGWRLLDESPDTKINCPKCLYILAQKLI